MMRNDDEKSKFSSYMRKIITDKKWDQRIRTGRRGAAGLEHW